MARIIHPDPFSPILLRSRSLNVSEEQTSLIKQILDVACSDSRFAQKAYVAIGLVLTQGPAVPPVINTLSPDTIAIGDPDATLHVHGTGFTSSSKIFFNGIEEPTTVVSPTELTTGINMSVWLDPQAATVTVRNGSVESDPATFTFTDDLTPEVASAELTDPLYQKPVEPTPTVNKEGKPFDQSELDRLLKPAVNVGQTEESSKETNTFNVSEPTPIKSLDEKEK